MTPEGKVKKKVSLFLKKYQKEIWYFMPAGSLMGRSGVPDYIGCCNGILFGIETKAGKNTLTSLQKHESEKIQSSGGKYYIINDKNINEMLNKFIEDFNLTI